MRKVIWISCVVPQHCLIFVSKNCCSASRRCGKREWSGESGVEIEDVYAEYVHFAELTSPLSPPERATLGQLLHSGAQHGPTIPAHTPSGQLFLVTPRPGTISPWSSKATDIAHNCGLKRSSGWSEVLPIT
ncbi:hypothetical protein [Aeromonas hydrophila]|uniref:hypothetical protein n=1 Tax=Aeromonas hydrophila TaxID=644 RepID=UPI003F7A670D